MESMRAAVPADDLSTLAWVHEELRKSLDAANKALRRYLRESETSSASDVDDVEPAILRGARQQIHQGVGALELVGLSEGAMLLRASETLVARFVAKPQRLDAAGVDAVERASFALLDYVARRLAGREVSPVALFPQLRALLELTGAERVHPADLWSHDWQWRDVARSDGDVGTRTADAQSLVDFESQLLAQMRKPKAATAQALADECAALANAETRREQATLWRLGAAFFEAWGHDLLPSDVFVKRMASRVLAQLRAQTRGSHDVPERLAQDLLFFSARAVPPQGDDAPATPRLAAVRQAFGLQGAVVDYNEAKLGRFDPARVAQARKRVVAAKDSWGAVAGGEAHRLASLNEQFSLVGDSIRSLYPLGEWLAQALVEAVGQTVQGGGTPAAPLAMEVATSLLYVEASLEDGEFDHPEQGERVQRLATRIDRVRSGAQPEPLEHWMEELYRRVSDRETIGSVVQELRSSLGEVERQVDLFFRNPSDRTVLIPVPNQLASMRGVLSVLGVDHAVQAVLRMRQDVEALVSTEVDPQRAAEAGTFDRLAGNLGALGFLFDMLNVQPQMAKSLFAFDAQAGTLNPVMGRQATAAQVSLAPQPAQPALVDRAQAVAEAAARPEVSLETMSLELRELSKQALVTDQPVLAATVSAAQSAIERAGEPGAGPATETVAREQVAQAMADFVATASEAVGLEPLGTPSRPMPLMATAPQAPVEATGLEEDDEMRDIFLEEAREVMQGAHESLAALASNPEDLGQLTSMRRAFHTLKGSSRMVGLKDFGDAAWSFEQLYNAWLADQKPASDALRTLTGDALDHFGAWVDAIAAKRDGSFKPAAAIAAADALRLEGRLQKIGAAAAAPAASIALPPVEVPAVPSVAPPVVVGTPPPAMPVAAPVAAPIAAVVPPPVAAPDALADFDLDEAPAPAREAAPQALPEINFTLDLPSLDEPAPAAPAAPQAVPAAFEEPFEFDLPAPEPATPIATPTPSEPLVAEAVELPDLPLEALDASAPLEDIEVVEVVEAIEAHESQWPDVADVAELATLDATAPEALAAPVPEPVIEPIVEPTVEPMPAGADSTDQVKQIGHLRIGIPLFNIYLNEADELSRRLGTELAEWAMELHRPVGETAVALAHSLAGSSATVGFQDLSNLARRLEHALARANAIDAREHGDAVLFVDVADEVRRLLHQFAAGFLKAPSDELLQRLLAWEIASAERSAPQTELATRLPALDAADDEPVEPAAPAVATDIDLGIDASEPPVAPAVPAHGFVASFPDVNAELPPAAPPAPAAVPAAEGAASVFAPSEFTPSTFAPSTLGRPSGATTFGDIAVSAFGTLPPTAFAELGQADYKPLAPLEVSAPSVPATGATSTAGRGDDAEDDIDAEDHVDAELFPIFDEEAQELLPRLQTQLRDWQRDPQQRAAAAGCMRTLHTFKGGARLAGAMRLGEMAHRLESAIERLNARESIVAIDLEPLQARGDALSSAFEALRNRDAHAYEEAAAAATAALAAPPVPATSPATGLLPMLADALPVLPPTAIVPVAANEPAPAADARPAARADRPAGEAGAIDWSRFAVGGSQAPAANSVERAASTAQAVRVRAQLLDRLVNSAGEVSISRARLQSDVGQIRSSIRDLTDNLERLRGQLRDIELQAETQMSTRLEAAKAAAQEFDPLEFDRFTRFQEITRMMAESVNDVASVQRALQRSLDSAEDDLAAQARQTRELQGDLLRTRMVEFEGMSERLYRVVRLAAKETGKQVRLDIVGGSIDIDRGVLERMTPSFEHLLRNCVSHGIEKPDARQAAGKDATGNIVVALHQEGNEVSVEFRDDGAGLDLARIRERAVALGLLTADVQPSEAELANCIFLPGFSTAETVTELSGRGVGLDVVRAEVNAIGGRIETASARGQGTSFKLVLPLTTAVTQVVMVRCGTNVIAIPSHLVEIVRRAKPGEVESAYAGGYFDHGGQRLLFFWLGALLQMGPRSVEPVGRSMPVMVIRSAQQRITVHVDEVLGNQEVVVKNLGPQLSRVPGLAGMTLLPSGAVALIYNPVALATVFGAMAHAAAQAPADSGFQVPVEVALPAAPVMPLVLVVDDSLTVRRVTQRLLAREGYRVGLAKDGLEALEALAEERPAVVLSDIEMPRMDGFDLLRNIRADAALAGLPVVMITSRIAQKHRDYAVELGANHYLGKPYSEEELLALVRRYAQPALAAAQPS